MPKKQDGKIRIKHLEDFVFPDGAAVCPKCRNGHKAAYTKDEAGAIKQPLEVHCSECGNTFVPFEAKKSQRKIVEVAIGAEFKETILNPPGEVTVVKDRETKEVSAAVIRTTEGAEAKLEGWALTKFYERCHRGLGIMWKELVGKPAEEQAILMTKAFNMRKSPLKVLMAGKTATSIVGPRHRQFMVEETKKELEEAVKEQLGEVEIESMGNSTLFRLPISNKYVSTWLRIDPGNNMAKGRSAIHTSTSFRTEYDTNSGGSVPACLNWANVWTIPKQLFNVKEKRLSSLEQEIGAEAAALLTGRNIHTTNKAEIDMEKFSAYIKDLIMMAPKIEKMIEKAIHTPLAKKEMSAILDAYHERVGVGKGMIKAILANVKEESVWGFSNAVSWVRTHEEIRGMHDKEGKELKDREALRMTQVLGNIAGEVLSIAPMIADIKAKVGPITLKVLGVKPKA